MVHVYVTLTNPFLGVTVIAAFGHLRQSTRYNLIPLQGEKGVLKWTIRLCYEYIDHQVGILRQSSITYLYYTAFRCSPETIAKG
jgi:hypothetical protein